MPEQLLRAGDRVVITRSVLLGGRTGTVLKRRRMLWRKGWLVQLDQPLFGGGGKTTVAEVALRRLPIE